MEDEKKINWLSLFIKIIIVFIFLLIIIWLVSKIVGNKLSDTFKSNINNMEEVAVTYFKEIDLPQEKGKSIKLTLEEMIEKKLIISINENNDKTCDVKKSYSKITRNKKDYEVETHLICGKEKDTITRKFNFKDCKNCNTNKEITQEENPKVEDSSKETPTESNPSISSQSVTYYEYVKETTTVGKWLRGTKTGNNIENKYDYYKTATKEYYTLGFVNKDKNTYTIKLEKVPNKDYYFTAIDKVEILNNNETNFSEDNTSSIIKGSKVNKIPKNITKYSLQENEFTYKLSPYYRKGNFYIDVAISNINTTAKQYEKLYFVPLKITVKFTSPTSTEEKPTEEYLEIPYYRYVETNKEIKWSTESSLEGYKKTGNTKEE